MITIEDVIRYRSCRAALRKLEEDVNRVSFLGLVRIETAYYESQLEVAIGLVTMLSKPAKRKLAAAMLDYAQKGEALRAQFEGKDDDTEMWRQMAALHEAIDNQLEEAIATVSTLNGEAVA